MKTQKARAHGVTPGLSQDYVTRRADQQAAFVLPYLRPGMDLLDIGCGPGTITLGLAQAVAPGQVTGIDHDRQHIEAARALASDQEVTNINFQIGDALTLPFENGSLDVAFENNMFTHLAQTAVQAAREAYRVLKPQGFFAARDVDADSVVWGHHNDLIRQLDELFNAWHKSRGSDITLGKRLPSILRQAGFMNTVKSVSADTKSTLEETRSHAQITISLLDGPFGRDIVNNGWVNGSVVERLKENIREWGEHPDAFFANVHVEVIGWKSG
jgi:ubiquinone/menaquinone biosynthesis C-methylase UbiE